MEEHDALAEVERIIRGEDEVKQDPAVLFRDLSRQLARGLPGATGKTPFMGWNLSNDAMFAFLMLAPEVRLGRCEVHGDQQFLLVVGFPSADDEEVVAVPMWGCETMVADKVARVALVAAVATAARAGYASPGQVSAPLYRRRKEGGDE